MKTNVTIFNPSPLYPKQLFSENVIQTKTYSRLAFALAVLAVSACTSRAVILNIELGMCELIYTLRKQHNQGWREECAVDRLVWHLFCAWVRMLCVCVFNDTSAPMCYECLSLVVDWSVIPSLTLINDPEQCNNNNNLLLILFFRIIRIWIQIIYGIMIIINLRNS